jgi:hypothetical protein
MKSCARDATCGFTDAGQRLRMTFFRRGAGTGSGDGTSVGLGSSKVNLRSR